MKFAAMVEEMGGIDAVQNNEQLMRELANEEHNMRIHTGEEFAPVARSGSGSDNRHGTDRSFNFIELKREIECPPDKAIEKNLEYFNVKFDLQKKRIEEAMERMERIVTAGPHDRIFDPVWREVFGICVN